jgi:hypothetical protein
MAQQTFNYIEKKLSKIAKGVPAPGIFKYLNDIEKLCSLKSDVKTVDEFLDIQHLENALAVKASFSVRDMVFKMQSSKEKRIVKVNDLFAADLV